MAKSVSGRTNTASWIESQHRWRIRVTRDGITKAFYCSTPGRKGQAEANRLATIYVSNILSQPSWWDDEFEYAFLGSYSDEKYTAFIVATGASDLSTLSNNEIIAYVREFIYYLRRMDAAGTPVYEADGVTKVLDSINYTNV